MCSVRYVEIGRLLRLVFPWSGTQEQSCEFQKTLKLLICKDRMNIAGCYRAKELLVTTHDQDCDSEFARLKFCVMTGWSQYSDVKSFMK